LFVPLTSCQVCLYVCQSDDSVILITMAHSIPDMIEMTGRWNKPIKPRNPNKISDTVNLQSQSFKRYVRVGDDGSIIDKPIQLYRMWYRFLQLALELEQKKVKIVTKNDRIKYDNLKSPPKGKKFEIDEMGVKFIRDKWGNTRYGYAKLITENVKIMRSKYKEWHLDTIPHTDFNDWWKQHRTLFLDETSDLITNKKDLIEDPNLAYISIDRRRRAEDIIQNVRVLLRDNKIGGSNTVMRYRIKGKPNHRTIINRYNALVLVLTTDWTIQKIFASDYFRLTKYKFEIKKLDANGKPEKRNLMMGREMRELLYPAKITLLNVCNGSFP